MSVAVTMYSTVWCGYCVRLKRHLEREDIGYTEVDIEQEPAAAELVEQVNGGSRTVPTVVVSANGTGHEIAMTNPTVRDIKAAMNAA